MLNLSRRAVLAAGHLLALWLAAAAAANAAPPPHPAADSACPSQPLTAAEASAALPDCDAFIAGLAEGDPARAAALTGRSYLLGAAGDFEAALKSAEAALQADPHHLEAGLRRAELLMNSDWPQARRALEELVSEHPAQPQVNRLYASFLAGTGSYLDAARAYDRAVAALPRDADLLRSRASVRLRLGQARDALADLDEALAQNPSDGRILSDRAEVHLHLGDAERAVADIENARANGVLPFIDAFRLARAQTRLGQLAPALESLDLALSVDGLEPRTMLLLYKLVILHGLGRTDRMESTLDTFIKEVEGGYVLGLQVWLRHIGFEDVVITGDVDEPTRKALLSCFTARACESSLANSITERGA
jgi:tetratricopeptide (TPR) repeat protein